MNSGAQLSAKRRQHDKVCPSCSLAFQGVKIAKYCSNRCRQKAKYRRLKAQSPIVRKTALSKELGLSSPYDWSNINIAPDVFILRVLEGGNVKDIARIAKHFGIERVGRSMNNITDALTLKISERQYNNVREIINGN